MSSDVYFQSIRRLAEYEVWCNARIFEAAGLLEPAVLHRQFGLGLGTIHRTLFHIVDVMRGWSNGVGPDIGKPSWLQYEPGASLASITRLNEGTAAAFVAAIDRSQAAGVLHQDRRIELAFHLVTHGTHHRTQIITMLRLMGIDPPFEAGDFGGWSNRR